MVIYDALPYISSGPALCMIISGRIETTTQQTESIYSSRCLLNGILCCVLSQTFFGKVDAIEKNKVLTVASFDLYEKENQGLLVPYHL